MGLIPIVCTVCADQEQARLSLTSVRARDCTSFINMLGGVAVPAQRRGGPAG